MRKILSDSKKFREKLVFHMKDLDSKTINCKNCQGVCCTKERNSMQVTPIEAMDLYFYLKDQHLINDELIQLIDESIVNYGLDREIYIKGKLFRKNYTCPLFKFHSWGCPIDPFLKPLGCLGYNPNILNVTKGENCSSDQKLLESILESDKQEWEKCNQKIKNQLSLSFDKAPIPVALKEIFLRMHNIQA
jgi:hypothetical protein